MKKKNIFIGMTIIAIFSVISFYAHQTKKSEEEKSRIAYLYELQNEAFEIHGIYEERCHFQTSEKIELSMLVVDLYA